MSSIQTLGQKHWGEKSRRGEQLIIWCLKSDFEALPAFSCLPEKGLSLWVSLFIFYTNHVLTVLWVAFLTLLCLASYSNDNISDYIAMVFFGLVFHTNILYQSVSLTSPVPRSAVIPVLPGQKRRFLTKKPPWCTAITKSLMFVSHLRRQGIVTSIIWALSPGEGRALNGINSSSGAITAGGCALHLQECPRCSQPPTAQQLPKKKPPQWHCLRTTMNPLLFDSAHTKMKHALLHVWWTPLHKSAHTHALVYGW